EESLEVGEQKIRLSLELNKESISSAVGAYIQNKLDRLTKLKKYDEKTQHSIQHYLSLNANDTFLWVALVVLELTKAESWEALDVINEVPTSLDELYGRMMGQIQGLDRTKPELCRGVLSAATTSYRPLHLAELGVLS
ncbi:hypothetical protein V8F06_014957, partial [Rhypophila decipiens]